MIALRTEREIDLLRDANAIVAEALTALADRVKPGAKTSDLDKLAEDIIRSHTGAVPAFLGYHGYPNATCISVDEVIIHGIPGDRILEEGQIVSMDVGVRLKGYHGDAAISVPCGEVDAVRERLLETTNLALANAIAAARPGNYLQDISQAVQETCEAEGFHIVRNFVGHGIGVKMHEDPQIPNFVTEERGPRLKAGMVFAIEPMVNVGTSEVKVLKDGWTAVTADGSPSAHFEHSIVIRDDEPEVLSFTSERVWGCVASKT